MSREGKLAEAEAAFRDALSLYRKLADDHPGVSEIRVRLALSHFQLGAQLSRWGKLTEAEVEYREMLALLQRLVDDHPEVTDFRKQLAFRRNSLAQLLLQAGKLAEAEAESRQALAIVRKLIDEHPGDGLLRRRPGGIPQDRRQLVVAGRQAGGGGGGIPPGAGDRPGIRRQPPRRPRTPRPPGGQPRGSRWVDVTVGQGGRGGDPVPSGADSPAEARRERSHQSQIPLLPGRAQNRLGEWLWGANKPAEAEAEFGEALAIQQKLADENPMDPQFPTELAKTMTRIGRLHQAAGHWAQAGNAFRQAVESSERLPSPTADNLYDLACYHALLSGALDRQGSAPAVAEARAAADRR